VNHERARSREIEALARDQRYWSEHQKCACKI
jgi:hypothetical protein